VEFRIVFENAGLFHGEVINAGSRCLRGAGGIVPFTLTDVGSAVPSG